MGFFDKVTGLFGTKDDGYEEDYNDNFDDFGDDNGYQEENYNQTAQPQQISAVKQKYSAN